MKLMMSAFLPARYVAHHVFFFLLASTYVADDVWFYGMSHTYICSSQWVIFWTFDIYHTVSSNKKIELYNPNSMHENTYGNDLELEKRQP